MLRFEQKISADKNPGSGKKSAKKQGLKSYFLARISGLKSNFSALGLKSNISARKAGIKYEFLDFKSAII